MRVCSLLVCTTLGLLAGAGPIRARTIKAIENEIEEIGDIITDGQNEDLMRLAREYKVFPRGLKIENDEGELVELTIEENVAGAESDEELKRLLDDRVFFRLYTRHNPQNYQPLWLNDTDSLRLTHFNADKPTHFITHGWINSGNSAACTLIRDAYLKNGDFNVIVVDWSKITMRPYNWAARHVVMVGKYVARMIDFLEAHARLNTNKTTLVGHSLGAHVMGLSGYYSKGTINYVFGLDPALPLFMFAGVGSRISTEDANHVQIIHTNAGLLGYFTEIGHSDFYPNGGIRQVGCFLDLGGACSHARSYRFYAESINTPIGFYGKACKSFLSYILGNCETGHYAEMGGPLIDRGKTGTYFLSTASASPFAKGK